MAGAGVVVVVSPSAPTPPLCPNASRVEQRETEPQGSNEQRPPCGAYDQPTCRSTRFPLSAAYGVSWRARAESGATNQLVAIRPWEENPFGSPANYFFLRIAPEGLGLDWRGSITTAAGSLALQVRPKAGDDVPIRPEAARRHPLTAIETGAIIRQPRLGARLFLWLPTAIKTYQATAQDRERDWYVVDAQGKTLGRLATQIADVLRGKRKPTYTPHVDVGDFVIVVNAEKVAVTGNKREAKRYWRHSGYPGGIRFRTLGETARAAARGGHPQGGQGHAPSQPPRPPAAPQAEGLCRPGPSPPGPEARDSWRSRLDAGRRADSSARGADARAAGGGTQGRPRSSRPPRGAQAAAEESPPRRRSSRRPRPREPRPRRARRRPPRRLPPRSRPAAPSKPGGRQKKKEEVVPGAELDPIAIEPERELDAEERARREAEEEERPGGSAS